MWEDGEGCASGVCGRMGRASAVRVVCVGGWGGLCEWCVWEDGEGCVSGVCGRMGRAV